MIEQEKATCPPSQTAVAWSVAGYDPSSGAGITADLQTFAAHRYFAATAITAFTVQTTQGVFGVQPVAPRLLSETLDRLRDDLPPLAIKIGMLGSPDAIDVVSRFLRNWSQVPVVVLDPVLRSSSGSTLLPANASSALRDELLPQVDWITPNGDELRRLVPAERGDTGELNPDELMERLGSRYKHLNIVRTGGDDLNTNPGQSIDVVRLASGAVHPLTAERVYGTSTHGTGCAFSSALAARLGRGEAPLEAVAGAKRYVTAALLSAPGVGSGKGPLGLLRCGEW